MTWDEFKALIETELIQQGIPDDAEIEYIDISRPCEGHEMCKPHVYFNGNMIAIH